ncbi:MAG: PEP-CTERM sorting domain-containing protein [Acidobacteriaceae bacterium]|nr:PEP-CTERM sorting domain-containing protein [Acidobacteriaceae bacterium]
MLHAANYTFQTINDPADIPLQTPVFNQLLGINNSGVIAGYFGDGTKVNNNGFTYQNGAFTAENVSGADQTQVVAINNTLTGGTYNTAGFSVINATGVNHGFTNVGGTFTQVDGPSTTFTQVLGLNDNSQAVGFYNDTNGNAHGFLYSLSTQKLTTLSLPASLGATAVTATGINNAGWIVGFYVVSGADNGFIYNPLTNTYSTPTDPNGTNPMFFGVNDLGQVVGTDTAAGGFPEGFVYDSTTNTWTVISDPASVQTANGFGISGTTLNGINDLGQVVGFYADAAGNVDGLLATPTPEPGTFGLVGLLLTGIALLTKRRFAGRG